MLSKQTRLTSVLFRLKNYGAIIAIVLVLFGLATPLLSVSMTQGGTGEVTWSELSASSLSLAIASLAAWGATLLTSSRSVRVFSTLQGLLTVTGLALFFVSLDQQQEVALYEAERVVGISGVVTLTDLMVTPHPVAFGLVIGLFISLLVSAVAGLIAPVTRSTRSSRYERARPETPSELWDQLSHGDDPTAR